MNKAWLPGDSDLGWNSTSTTYTTVQTCLITRHDDRYRPNINHLEFDLKEHNLNSQIDSTLPEHSNGFG